MPEILLRAPAGTKDILPDEASLWGYVEEKAKKIFDIFGYQAIRTPLIENSSLFNRSLGRETEIIKKQMFLIQRDEETFCLRPEATASVVRAYIENNIDKVSPFIKLYYIGPMFRAERPQKGRLRQFHHIGVEALGSSSPYLDSEVVTLAHRLLQELDITGYTIKLNSLGCIADKQKFSQILKAKLSDKLQAFCDDCKDRYTRNVFRILDCKNQSCKDIVEKLDLKHEEYLCPECLKHFAQVQDTLTQQNIPYTISLTLIRGLDYYNRTVFEISHPELGAQDALGAGGRYDNLIAELGGPKLGAIGFALGMERLLLASKAKNLQPEKKIKVFIITLGEAAKNEGFALLNQLRLKNIPGDMDYEERSLKAQMRKANDLGVRLVVLLGDNELKKRAVSLKDMQSGNQEELSIDTFIDEIQKRIS